MRKLGLIGGIGPEATIPYYHDIIYGVQRKVGKPFFPELVIESLSCFEVIPMSAQNRRRELKEYLLAGVKNLAAAGADFGALACNTAHMVFDELQRESPIPLVSIVEAAAREAGRRGIKKAGLLGTAATMEDGFFQKPFAEAGIEVAIPRKEERELIADRILNELELGIVRPETTAFFCGVAERMARENGIQAVILGCTELPLAFQGAELSVGLLDTMEIHVDTLVEEILKEN